MFRSFGTQLFRRVAANRVKSLGALGLMTASSFTLMDTYTQSQTHPKHFFDQKVDRSTLKEISLEDVEAHNCMKTGVWVTLDGLVYDITTFIDEHPVNNPNKPPHTHTRFLPPLDLSIYPHSLSFYLSEFFFLFPFCL